MTKLETAYSKESDITTIFVSTYDETGEKLLKMEVTGFYFGEPDETAIRVFNGKRTAEFD